MVLIGLDFLLLTQIMSLAKILYSLYLSSISSFFSSFLLALNLFNK